MATISSIGIGSGLDVESVITQLVALERTPVTQLQKEATSLQTKLSTYGKLQSGMAALRDAASALTRASTWGATTGSSSDAAAVTVTTSSSTLPGSYAIEVQRLASVQSNATGVYASADSLVGEGTLRIELGSWSADQSSFSPKAGATAVDITVGPPAESLAQLRDKINASNSGVVASVLTDASGARLVLRSAATGEMNGFRIGVTDTDGNNSDGLGLSALAFDPSAGILTMAQALAAANAAATLNGLAISSDSNTLSNVLDGMTMTLGKVTTAPVLAEAKPDTASIRKAMDSFVTAYNDLNKLVAEQTKYDAASKTAGVLQGDSAAVAIRTQMRNLLGSSGGNSTMFSRLADIGFDVQNDGAIKLERDQARQWPGQPGRDEAAVRPHRPGHPRQQRHGRAAACHGRPGAEHRRQHQHAQRRPAQAHRPQRRTPGTARRPHHAGREAAARAVHRAGQADGVAEQPVELRHAADRCDDEQQQQQLKHCGATPQRLPRTRRRFALQSSVIPGVHALRGALKSPGRGPIFKAARNLDRHPCSRPLRSFRPMPAPAPTVRWA